VGNAAEQASDLGQQRGQKDHVKILKKPIKADKKPIKVAKKSGEKKWRKKVAKKSQERYDTIFKYMLPG
jgi:hypothetical protein